MNPRVPLVILVAFALFAPAAAAQAVTNGTPDFQAPAPPPSGTDRVEFYGYVFASTTGTPMPANTQYPWGVADWGSGLVDPPLSCGLPSQPTCDEYDVNKVALFTTAGPVQVKEVNDFAYEKLHNENGLTQDIMFDTTQDITATIHLSTAVHAWPHNENETACLQSDPPQNVPCWQNYWRWHSGANPNFQVRGWLYAMQLGEHGADASRAPPVETILASGSAILVGTGQTTPTNVVSADGNGGYERVWRFDLNLGAPLVDFVPKTHDLVMVYSYHNVMPDGSETLNNLGVRINTGEFFPTIFSIPVKNAFTVELVVPRILHDKLVILGVMNTPWGSYDVDPASIKVEIADSSGGVVETPGLRAFGDYSVAHGAHYKPINVTFVWDHKEAKLKAGSYAVTLSAANYQHSASDSLTAFIEIDDAGRLVRAEPGRADVTTFTAEEFLRFASGASDAAGGDQRSAPGDLVPSVAVPGTDAEPTAQPTSTQAAQPARDVPAVAPFLGVLTAFALAAVGRRWSK